jgi:superfamily I DNA and/or RNA helicase
LHSLGQEKKVIIISTVLHSIPPVERGEHIGLFNDHRRFNVSVTRGKALVVVVGHPVALCMDPYFKVYFEYCFKNGAYRGYLSDVATVNTFVSSAKEQASLGEGAAAISHYSDNQEWRVMI